MGHVLRNDEFITPDEYLAGEAYAANKHESGQFRVIPLSAIGCERFIAAIYERTRL